MNPEINWYPQESQVLAHGFVKVPETNTLYRHPRYPGLIFKRTTELRKAMACGGVIVMSGTLKKTAYFGATMVRAFHAGAIGMVLRPAGLQAAPRNLDVRWTNTGSRSVEGIVYPTSLEMTWFHDANPIGMGIYFKGDDGMLLESSADGLDGGVLPTSLRNTPDWATPSSQLSSIMNDEGSKLRFKYHGIAGFVSYQTWTNAKKFIKAGREAFMAKLPEDDRLRGYFGHAFDQALDEMSADANLDTSIKLHLDPVSGKWSWINPQASRASGVGSGAEATALSHMSALFVVYAPPSIAPYNDALAPYWVTLPQNAFYVDPTGRIYPIPMVGILPTETSSQFARARMVIPSGEQLVDPAGVVLKDIKFNNGQTVGVGAVVPALLIDSKPHTTRIGTLALPNPVEEELAYYSRYSVGAAGWSVTSADPAVEAQAGDVRNSTLAEIALDQTKVSPVNVYLLTRFVERVDELAREALGG